jgi:hypothetical protein
MRYTDIYGDGDRKSLSEVKNTYPGIQVQERECIGHDQKRVGTAFRKLKKDNPGQGCMGKLTNAMIYMLQNYYGIAVRFNVGDLAWVRCQKPSMLVSSIVLQVMRTLTIYLPLHSWKR